MNLLARLIGRHVSAARRRSVVGERRQCPQVFLGGTWQRPAVTLGQLQFAEGQGDIPVPIPRKPPTEMRATGVSKLRGMMMFGRETNRAPCNMLASPRAMDRAPDNTRHWRWSSIGCVREAPGQGGDHPALTERGGPTP